MQPHNLFLLLSLGLVMAAAPAFAAGTVQLELVGDAQGSALLFQEWAQLLGKAGINNVRIRIAQGSDKVGVETQGAADNPVYVVTGIIKSRDELVLPGGRFRRSEVGRLAQWLKDLAERGPAAGKETKAAFGLSTAQFERVRADLAAPLGFATHDMTRRQIVQKISERLKLTLKLDAETGRALADDKEAEELIDLSCGTALAYVLRPAGYCIVPRAMGNEIVYAVVKARPDLEAWPVGQTSEKPAQEGLPALFEFLNVNVQNVSAAQALEAIAKRLKVPAPFDQNALTRHGIDPAKKIVTLPRGRTTYSLALRKLLFQAGMKFEVRYDESGSPFLWITSVKPA